VPLGGLLVQNIGEEKQLQHKEDDEQLDKDYHPQSFTYRHVFETIIIKMENG